MRLEPLWWGLFSVGGTVAAFLLPVHIFLNNVAVPLGWVSSDAISYDHMSRLIGNPLVKLYLVALIVLTLFHTAHRMAALPHDFMLAIPKGAIATASRLMATILAIWGVTVVVLA